MIKAIVVAAMLAVTLAACGSVNPDPLEACVRVANNEVVGTEGRYTPIYGCRSEIVGS